MRIGWSLAAGMIVIGLLPVAAVLLSSVLAWSAGCAAGETGAQACRVADTDLCPWLAMLFVSGWYLVITATVASAEFAPGIGLAVAALVRRLRR